MRQSMAFDWGRGFAILASFLLLLGVHPAGAIGSTPEDEGDEDTGRGTARVTLGEPFAIPSVEGQRWASHIFEQSGRLLLLQELVRSETYEFLLDPMNPNIENATLVIGPDCWKLQAVRRGVVEWRCDRRVTFKRAIRPQPAVEPPKPTIPEDDFEIPPMPGVPPPPPPRDPFDD